MSWASPEDIYLSTSLASYLDSEFLSLLMLHCVFGKKKVLPDTSSSGTGSSRAELL